MELEVVGHALPDTDGKAAIERLRVADRVGDGTEVREGSVASVADGVGVDCRVDGGTDIGLVKRVR